MSQLDVGCESEAALLLPPFPGAVLERALEDDETPEAIAAKALRPVFVTVALFLTAIAMTVPTRPKLILNAANDDVSNASYFTGVVDGMTAFVEIFTSPVLGAISDEVGRRPVLILSQFGELAALLIIARFHTYYAGYAAAYLLIGLTGVFFLTVNTIVADVSTHGDLEFAASNYGVLGAVFGACFMVGPVLGGLLEDRLYPTASFHAAALMVTVSVIWTCFAVSETLNIHPTIDDSLRRDDYGVAQEDSDMRWLILRAVRKVNLNPIPRIRRVFSNDALRWLAAAISLSSLAQGALNSVFFLYLHTRVGWGSAETGMFLSLVGLSLLIAQGGFAKHFVRLLGEKNTILIGFGLAAVHYAVYGLANRAWIVYAGLVFGCVSFVGEPAIKGLLSRQVPKSEQGSLQGGLAGLTTLLRPLSPLFGTAIFGYGNSIGRPGLVFAAVSTVSSISFAVVTIALRKPGIK